MKFPGTFGVLHPNLLLSISWDGTTRLWDPITREQLLKTPFQFAKHEVEGKPPEWQVEISTEGIYLTDSAHRHFGIVEAFRLVDFDPNLGNPANAALGSDHRLGPPPPVVETVGAFLSLVTAGRGMPFGVA